MSIILDSLLNVDILLVEVAGVINLVEIIIIECLTHQMSVNVHAGRTVSRAVSVDVESNQQDFTRSTCAEGIFTSLQSKILEFKYFKMIVKPEEMDNPHL